MALFNPLLVPGLHQLLLSEKRMVGCVFFVNYRRLNYVTRKDLYPLLRIDDALDSLTHARWFSTLDLSRGYWQVEVDPKDRPKTEFYYQEWSVGI